jgi:hypothetical protein
VRSAHWSQQLARTQLQRLLLLLLLLLALCERLSAQLLLLQLLTLCVDVNSS